MPVKDYQHLYNSKIWIGTAKGGYVDGLRHITFRRDLYRCQVCNKPVSADKRHRHEHYAAVCNHIIKHEGDYQLFADPDNLQTACKQCHDQHIQSIEKGGTGKQPIGLDGWPAA